MILGYLQRRPITKIGLKITKKHSNEDVDTHSHSLSCVSSDLEIGQLKRLSILVLCRGRFFVLYEQSCLWLDGEGARLHVDTTADVATCRCLSPISPARPPRVVAPVRPKVVALPPRGLSLAASTLSLPPRSCRPHFSLHGRLRHHFLIAHRRRLFFAATFGSDLIL
jgi:hypothetical protein